MRVAVSHQFQRTTVNEFVEVYYSDAFNRAVAPVANLASRELIEAREDEEGRIERRVRIVPDVKLPLPIRKLLRGQPVSYVEWSLYDPKAQRAEYRIESGAKDVVKVWGEIRFQAGPAPGTVVREIDGQVLVKVPALGRAIEKLIARELSTRYDAIQAFTQKFLDQQVDRTA